MKDEYQRANLHREARVMAILRHPNIVRLYETLKVIMQITSLTSILSISAGLTFLFSVVSIHLLWWSLFVTQAVRTG